MKKQKATKYNPYVSDIFQIEDMRNKARVALLNEYMVFLGTLYGAQINEGSKAIKDYNYLTMPEVRLELELRIKMMRTNTNNKIRKHVETEKRKQDELLRRFAGSMSK
jgi:hypothetical protein